MDDVWVVIGLLLFGSLLFCLCCYKVTNLLYMLYHIDDSTESLTANDINNATTASAVAAAAASAASNAASSAAMGSLPIALALEQEQNNKSMETNVCPSAIFLSHFPNLFDFRNILISPKISKVKCLKSNFLCSTT